MTVDVTLGVTPTPAENSRVRRLMVMPLGELSRELVRDTVIHQLGLGNGAQLTWADRNLLRGNPVKVVAHVLRARARSRAGLDDAVLVAPDLRQPRLRLTSLLLLALPPARRMSRLDVLGRCEPFFLSDHLARNGWPIVRHATALALAALLAGPLSQVLASRVGALLASQRGALRAGRLASGVAGSPRPRGQGAPLPRRPALSLLRALARAQSSAGRRPSSRSTQRPSHDATTKTTNEGADAQPRSGQSSASVRILYLRSQLWLGLSGGGSVAHTAGVIGGLQAAGRDAHTEVDVQVVSSDTLPGVTAPTTVVPPETWFDGPLRELEELVYTVPFALAALRIARTWHVPAQASRRISALYQRHTTFNCSGAILKRILGWPLILEFNSSEVWKGQYWGGLHHTFLAELIERINLAAADRVVVVSRVLEKTLVSQGVPAAKILVNPNAVDTRLFGPHVNGSAVRTKLGFAPDDIVVGFSGTFGLWHGIPTLAATLAPVARSRPRVRWLLIGDGPLRHLVDSAVQEHGLGDQVQLPGLVPHADMPAYLAACDILVSPHGRQADGGEFFGSPTKLFEYMASARPIVASAVGQIADVLEHEQTALLVPPDDFAALAEAIARLVDDPELRARLGQAARRAAVEHHTWRQNAERVLATLT